LTCESGPGSYTSLYEQVAFQFVDPNGDVPTWFSSSNSLYSIFGGSSQSVPVDDGTTAYFDPVTATSRYRYQWRAKNDSVAPPKR